MSAPVPPLRLQPLAPAEEQRSALLEAAALGALPPAVPVDAGIAASAASGGALFVTGAAAVRRALLDPALSSDGNFRIEGRPQGRPRMVTQLDPPEHTPVRRLLMATAFGPRPVDRARPLIAAEAAAHVDRAVAALARDGEVDLVAAVTRPYPATVVFRLVGVPTGDVPQLLAWTERLHDILPDPYEDEPEGRAFLAYLGDLVAARRAGEPVDDVLGRLLADAGPAGRPLTDLEVRTHLQQLVMAGSETTSALLGNLLHALLAPSGGPDGRRWWDAVLADRPLLDPLVEESLRLDAPLQWVLRRAVRDTELDGVPVPAGTVVHVGLQAANLDPADWGDDAARFRAGRPRPHRQVAFGHGPHLCAGASLARVEAQVLVAALLDRLPGLRLAPGETYRPRTAAMVRAPHGLRVVPDQPLDQPLQPLPDQAGGPRP